MKYVFIVNPFAGKGQSESLIRDGIAQSDKKDDCEVYVTKLVGDATKIVKTLCQENPDVKYRFIACGGDGTINEVFNGAVGYDNAEVSCYPCGSGNDFVKAFGGADKFLNISNLINAPTQKLDLLKVGDRYSNNVVNFGFDTTVAITINKERERTGHGNKNAYTKGVITALIKSMKNTFTVVADGKVVNPKGKALLCTVANGQYVGGSFKCAPRAKTDDGLIEVCLVDTISRLKFVQLLGSYTAGNHLEDKKFKKVIHYCRAKKVEVHAEEGFAYSLDGEIVYEKDFTIEIVPGALNLAVPE